MPTLDGIKHPSFVRLNKTDYAIFDGNNNFRSIIHVGQIFKYLTFDQALREGKRIHPDTERPYGYLSFANMFNRNAYPRDSRRLSTYITTASGQYHVIKSRNPVFIHEFRISSDQCGVDIPRAALTESQAAVFEEYATTMANQNAKRRKAIQDRQERRRDAFRKPTARKRRYFEVDTEYDPVTSLNIEAGDDQSFFYDVPTNLSSNSSNSQPDQQTITPVDIPDAPSDFYMGNAESSSVSFVDPLAHLSITTPEEANPNVPEFEDGQFNEIPE
jgi:hypothetical protein